MSDKGQRYEEYIQVIHEFIQDKVKKTGAEGVVLGLSGGLDSATVLKLCVDALGKEKVHCIINPEDASPEEDMEDAPWYAEELDVRCEEEPIDELMEVSPAEPDEKLPYANFKARMRMCIWYYHANVESKLVVGTSNKSEILLGYTTKYGDNAADFLPMGDIFKSEVRDIAEIIGVPERFLNKTPRAGLWEGQTDEKEIGYPYDEIDQVLKELQDTREVEKIAERTGFDTEEVQDIKDMVYQSAHKRKIPTIAKVRGNTVGIDWREFTD